jgi:arylsulfatase A-like enzyme
MGYRTPNIDRIANEGMRFTDSYGEQSRTAGRAAFISGQSVYRTGMSKVGMPGVDVGLQKEDPTIAELLKPLGYATGQFGKNHLGDLNKYLPTAHGFDEFFGNLYHLNAEEEPEHEDYPTAEEAPLLRKALLPRGVIHSWATDEDSGEVDDRYGPVGKQRIEDTGPLTKVRMETIDDETTGACVDFIKRQHEAGTPFFVWMNVTHMHFRTHTKPERQRPAREQLARRCDDPVPQREGHQLGGRLPDTGDDPLDRKDQAPLGFERDCAAP